MFLGEFFHSLDPKGRLILPARFRELLTQAYVTSQLDGCLALWTPAEFQSRAEEMKDLAKGTPTERNMARVFFASAQEASPDRQGRIAIPANLRRFANLDEGRQVVVNGHFDHVEIWDLAAWEQARAAGESALHGAGLTGMRYHPCRQQQQALRPCATLRPESGKTPLFAPSTVENGSRRCPGRGVADERTRHERDRYQHPNTSR